MIVGGGIAGLNAAYELEYNYPDVNYVVLEQLDVLTGSLHGSGGAIISDKSKKHAELGQESTIEEIIKILDGGTGYPVNHDYAKKVYSIGEDILNRILDNGLNIKTSYLSAKAYSDQVYAIFADGNGEGFVQFYYDWVEKQPINLRMHSKVTKLLTEDGKVTGVTVEDGEKVYDIKAKAVLLAEHLRKGYAKKYDSLEELADGMKINKENLLATVEAYNAAAANGTELEFGLAAASATVLDTAPYYVERVIPFYLGSIPSLKVDESMHLLNGEDQIVEGLYCAGELTEANLWDNVYPGVGVGISYATYSGPYAIRCMMEDWAK